VISVCEGTSTFSQFSTRLNESVIYTYSEASTFREFPKRRNDWNANFAMQESGELRYVRSKKNR
jgi:hypothetical protein